MEWRRLVTAPASIAPAPGSRIVRVLQSSVWWLATFAALVVVGDISDGWVFWVIAHFSVWLSAASALVWAWGTGYWLTLRGLSPSPGRIASFFLRRLSLEPSGGAVAERTAEMHRRVTSIAWAVPMTLLLGGVVTTLVMRKSGVIVGDACRRWGCWLSGLFAVEFAAIHGLAIGGALAKVT